MPPYVRFSEESAATWHLRDVLKDGDSSATATLPINEPPTIIRRQDSEAATVTVISESDDNDGGDVTLSAGAIAGIVIGSIVGFLILLWLVRSCLNLGAPPRERESWYRYVDADEKRPSHGSSHHHHHRHSRSRSKHRSSSGRRTSSTLPVPSPVVVVDGHHQKHQHHPRRSSRGAAYYYPQEGSRGRRSSRDYY